MVKATNSFSKGSLNNWFVVMAACLLYFGLLISFYFSNALQMVEYSEEINHSLQKLANHVIEKYFGNNRCIVVISEKHLLRDLNANVTVTYFETESENEDCYLVLHEFLKETFKENCDG